MAVPVCPGLRIRGKGIVLGRMYKDNPIPAGTDAEEGGTRGGFRRRFA